MSRSAARRSVPLRSRARCPLGIVVAVVATCLLTTVDPVGTLVRPAGAQSRAPEGAGFTLNASDLRFILRQIQISENSAETGQTLLGSGPMQISDATLPYGLRTVDGSQNNLLPGRNRYGAADRIFPRLSSPLFSPAEPLSADLDGPSPGSQSVGDPTSYASNKGFVEDSQARVASNLIVDQTAANPAAVAAAGLSATPEGGPNGPLFIPNVALDAGLSAPYNSWFTLFGQFFDHGLDLTKKGGGTVYVPLKDDDPLIAGPDHVRGNADDLPPHLRFMMLTRTRNQPGPDGQLGTADDVKEHTNQTTAFVDQNQTYTSHPSHQVFLREYDATDPSTAAPRPTGRLLDGGAVGGLATWAGIKAQARRELGIQLSDVDVLDVPKLRTDAYGRYLAGPRGYPQIELASGTLEGDPTANGGNGVLVPADAKRTGHAFLDDIAHHATPRDSQGRPLSPDTDAGTTDDRVGTTYDDEMLDAHYIAGDGRTNENIGLTAVHSVFHAEHNRLVAEIDTMITNELPDAEEQAWKDASTAGGQYWDYGERLLQAARFVTEMQYQHLVFEEFGRKVQPQINAFEGYDETIDPAIVAEFAHATYRFGHSLLNERVDRIDANGSRNDIGLIGGFLNPPAFLDNGRYANADQAVGAIARGMTQQTGNELDEFVTEALRNNLLGLPLDLAAINMLRGRDAGVRPLNQARREFFAASGDAALAPYADWTAFGRSIRNGESLVNFVAAYGKHESITSATTNTAKRRAARAIITGEVAAADDPPVPADSAAFMNATSAWATKETGLDLVDFWTGGLAEKPAPFGGMLGSTMNFVFETQLENLQDGDRFYYLSRAAGLNLLVQLEGNSFAELVQRNSDAAGLPADVFSRPDYRFDLSAQTTPAAIVDDPATEYDETTLLTRAADGTIRFGGPEHVNWIGTDASGSGTPAGGGDRVVSGEGDDTLRGNGGDDRLEGAAGNDQFIGGLGNDVLTDSFGDDVLKGGGGHDALSSGQGFDLNQGGAGDDFVLGGADPTETFGGSGDDLIFAGASADTASGDDGDDWIQGGGQADELVGDNGAPFQNDLNGAGSDVLMGEGGNDDYEAEGGNDVLVAGAGIDHNDGLLGFDWVTHKGDAQPADADMRITGFLPPSVEALKDRFDTVEGLSGHERDDILRGDDRGASPPDLAGHELTAAGVGEISGLGDVLPPGRTSHDTGNIILGGAGSDLIEGRGGDDVIDGDKWLDVQLRVPDLTSPGTTRLVDNLGAIRTDVLAGRIDGGQIEIVRTIRTGSADIDTAVFSGASTEYSVDNRGDLVVVAHTGGTKADGIDHLAHVERLSFTGDRRTVEVQDIPTNRPPSGTLAFDDAAPTEGRALNALVAITDPDGIATVIRVETQNEIAPGVWQPTGEGRQFTPGAAQVGRRLRLVATFTDGDGVQESVTSTPTAAVRAADAPAGSAPAPTEPPAPAPPANSPAGPAPAPAAPGGVPAAPAAAGPKKVVSYAGPKTVSVNRTGIATIAVRCSRTVAVRCTGSVQLRHDSGKSYGRASYRAAPGAMTRVRIKLPAARLKAFRTTRRLRSLTVLVTAADRAGWKGTARARPQFVRR